MRIATCLSILLVFGAQQVFAETLYFDNFSDKDYTKNPVSWYPTNLQQGILDASSGSFELRRNENSNLKFEVAAVSSDVVSQDISLRLVGKPLETKSVAGVAVRAEDPEDTLGYFAGVAHDANVGGSFVLAGIGLTDNVQTFFDSTNGTGTYPLPYDVREIFTNLQIDVIGNEIKVWAWRDKTEMPDAPIFVATDDTYTNPGHVRLVSPRTDASVDIGGAAVYRSVHASTTSIVPEPSAATLGSFALAAIALLQRRRRRWPASNT